MTQKFFTLLLFFIFASSSISLAQRPTQEELELETMYIEATRARLLEDHETAIEIYKQILEKEDDNHVVLFELGKVYLLTEAPKEALVVIKKAVSLEPRNIWYQEELAAAHAANDDFIAAAEVYKSLVSQSPNEQKFYYDLAFYQVKNNNLKQAIGTFNRHESKFGVSEEVIGRKFNLYRALDNVSKAEQELVKLTKAYPSEVNYVIGLAKFYEDINNSSKAKSAYEKILKIEPDNQQALVALNTLDKGKSKPLDDELWSDPEVSIDIKISKIINSIKALETAPSEKQNKIINITATIAATHPEEAKAHAVYGDVLNFSGKTNEAILAYETALKFEKNIFSVWNQLLSLYMTEFKMPALLEYSEKALDYFPNEGIIYYWNGFASNKLLEYNSAINTLRQANIMTTSNEALNAQVNMQWAVALIGLGKMDKAEEKFDDLTKYASNNAELLTETAYFKIAQGKLEEASTFLASAQKLKPNHWQISLAYGRLEYERGSFDQAKTYLETCESNAPKAAFHFLELFGDTEFQIGNVEEAVKHWKASKSAGNPSTVLIKKISSRQI